MDYFGYETARVAGRAAGAGIYSSARWATERVDGFPPPLSPLPERYELRYLRDRIGGNGNAPMEIVAIAIREMVETMDPEDVPTPKYKCPSTRKRARKQEAPTRR